MTKKFREEGHLYDVIFMDYIMPNMSGVEATRNIRELGIKSKIFGVTGNLLKEDVAEFESAGAQRVIGKPFQLESIYDIIRGRSITLFTFLKMKNNRMFYVLDFSDCIADAEIYSEDKHNDSCSVVESVSH